MFHKMRLYLRPVTVGLSHYINLGARWTGLRPANTETWYDMMLNIVNLLSNNGGQFLPVSAVSGRSPAKTHFQTTQKQVEPLIQIFSTRCHFSLLGRRVLTAAVAGITSSTKNMSQEILLPNTSYAHLKYFMPSGNISQCGNTFYHIVWL